jgi:hypothetical protein
MIWLVKITVRITPLPILELSQNLFVARERKVAYCFVLLKPAPQPR